MFLLRTLAAALLLGGAIAAALAFALRRVHPWAASRSTARHRSPLDSPAARCSSRSRLRFHEAIRAGVSWRGAVSILGGVALGGLLIFAAIHVKGPGSSEYDGVVLVLGAVAIAVLGASGAMAGSGHR